MNLRDYGSIYEKKYIELLEEDIKNIMWWEKKNHQFSYYPEA